MSASTLLRRPVMDQRRERGFTLIELMVTIALVAVMLVLAAPSFVTFQRNAQLTSAANSLLAALSAARAEAMKRQLRTFVVPGNATTASTNWADGWTVYVDVNSDAAAGSLLMTNGTDVVVARQDPLPSGVSITSSSFGLGGDAYVMFNGSGFPRYTDNSFPTDMSIELTNGTESRRVILGGNGRVRVCKPADTGCAESTL